MKRWLRWLPPVPWRESDDVERVRALSALEAAAGRPPGPARMDRMWRRIQTEVSVGGRRRPALLPRLAAIAVLCGAAGVGIASVTRVRDRLAPRTSELDEIVPRQLGKPVVRSPAGLPPTFAPDAPRRKLSAPKRSLAVAHAEHAAAAPSGARPIPDRVAAETALVRAAMSDLRAGAPTRALARLDERDAVFSPGVLAQEAAMVRVEALLAAGRSSEALARLEALPSAELSRRLDLRVAKAELRAATGRCAEALVDLDEVVRADPARTLRERAEYAGAVCAGRLGRRDEARARLERLLERYPDGRFAAEARRALGR